MQALPANILELELALNEVTLEGAHALAAALQRLPHLQRLSLRENELGNEGAIAVAKGLSGLKDLRELDLTQNQVLSHQPCSHLCVPDQMQMMPYVSQALKVLVCACASLSTSQKPSKQQ